MGDDDGSFHKCDANADTPFITFSADGVLSCGCTASPQYQSRFIFKEKCAGYICGGLRGEAPILDWDEDQGRCRCREHPCKDINGVQHGCSGYFPILRYKEELQDGNVVPKCDCVMPMRGPTGDHYDHINYDL